MSWAAREVVMSTTWVSEVAGLQYTGIALIASVALAGAALLTPLSIVVARRFGVVAEPTPGAEAVHSELMPRLGGLAIVGAVALAAALALSSFPIWRPATRSLITVIAVGGVVMAVVGLLDDMQRFPWRLKLICEIAVAGGAALVGVRLGGLPPIVAMGLAVIWIVGVTNAVNFIDGMDGLAAGVSGIAALAFMVIAAQAGAWHTAMLAAALVGACLGFLLFNFYPSKTFMGDSGSLFLGFTLAALLLPLANSPERYSVFCAAIVALGLPIHDTLTSMYRRWRHGQSMFTGDLGHYYNQLIDRFGFSQRTTALLSYGVAALFGLLAVWVATLRLPAALPCGAGVSIVTWAVAAKLGFTDHSGITVTEGSLAGS